MANHTRLPGLLRQLRQPFVALAAMLILINLTGLPANAGAVGTLCIAGEAHDIHVPLDRTGRPLDQRIANGHCLHCITPSIDGLALAPPDWEPQRLSLASSTVLSPQRHQVRAPFQSVGALGSRAPPRARL